MNELKIRADVLAFPEGVWHSYCKYCDKWYSGIHSCPLDTLPASKPTRSQVRDLLGRLLHELRKAKTGTVRRRVIKKALETALMDYYNLC